MTAGGLGLDAKDQAPFPSDQVLCKQEPRIVIKFEVVSSNYVDFSLIEEELIIYRFELHYDIFKLYMSLHVTQ